MALENHLSLLAQALREHEPPFVFATPEDANFFRSQVQRALPIEKPKVEVFVPPPPLPVPPKPIVVEKPVPPPPPKPVIKEEPAEPRPKLDFSLVRNVLSVVAPELAILNEIPNDAIARKISQRWKTKNQTAPISVLCYQEPAEQRALLEGIVTALDVYFGPAKIVHAEGIEKEKQWEMFLGVTDLKMIIVCDYTLWQLHGLMHFYKEIPSQGVRTLGNVPLFLLPDLSLYLKDPLLKRSLWKALCQKFS